MQTINREVFLDDVLRCSKSVISWIASAHVDVKFRFVMLTTSPGAPDSSRPHVSRQIIDLPTVSASNTSKPKYDSPMNKT